MMVLTLVFSCRYTAGRRWLATLRTKPNHTYRMLEIWELTILTGVFGVGRVDAASYCQRMGPMDSRRK